MNYWILYQAIWNKWIILIFFRERRLNEIIRELNAGEPLSLLSAGWDGWEERGRELSPYSVFIIHKQQQLPCTSTVHTHAHTGLEGETTGPEYDMESVRKPSWWLEDSVVIITLCPGVRQIISGWSHWSVSESNLRTRIHKHVSV